MAHEKKRITSKTPPPTQAQKKKRLSKVQSDYFANSEYSVDYCMTNFLFAQVQRGNSTKTIDFYKRFRKKFYTFLATVYNCTPEQAPVEMLMDETTQTVFMVTMGDVTQQTINSYLRAYRAFGNYCKETGYIDSFECPIKEVEPPVKQVYTDREIDKLLVKPKVEEFSAFRMFCIISLILNTGARSNTILNIRIGDLDLEEGFISFNTTKAHKVVRLGLDKRVKRDLTEWLYTWRYDKGATDDDFLFCNEYGEQMARSTLTKSMRVYCNKRGIEKTSLHLLRHTFAKKWITSGGDIITLAKVLTHSELEMVKRYANLYGEDIKSEIEVHSAIAQVKSRSGKTLKNQKRRLMDE